MNVKVVGALIALTAASTIIPTPVQAIAYGWANAACYFNQSSPTDWSASGDAYAYAHAGSLTVDVGTSYYASVQVSPNGAETSLGSWPFSSGVEADDTVPDYAVTEGYTEESQGEATRATTQPLIAGPSEHWSDVDTETCRRPKNTDSFESIVLCDNSPDYEDASTGTVHQSETGDSNGNHYFMSRSSGYWGFQDGLAITDSSADFGTVTTLPSDARIIRNYALVVNVKLCSLTLTSYEDGAGPPSLSLF